MATATRIGATIEVFGTVYPFVPMETIASVILTFSIHARYGGTFVDEFVAMCACVILITVTGIATI